MKITVQFVTAVCLTHFSAAFSFSQSMDLPENQLISPESRQQSDEKNIIIKNSTVEKSKPHTEASCWTFLFPNFNFDNFFFPSSSQEGKVSICQKFLFDNLPKEVISIIEHHLNTREYTASDLYNLSLLNKRFNTLMKLLPLRLTMESQDIETKGFKHLTLERTKIFVSHYKNIHQLHIKPVDKYSPIETDKFFFLFSSLPNLTHLSLENNTILGNYATPIIADFLDKGNSTLTSLNLENSGINDDAAKGLAVTLQNNDTLTFLNLRRNRVHSRTFLDFVKLNTNTRNIILPSIDTSSYQSNIDTIIREIEGNNPKLNALDISHNNFEKEGSIILSKLLLSLQSNTTLTYLDLSKIIREYKPCFVMDDVFINLIAEMIEQNKKIIYINLTGNSIRNEDMSTLLEITKDRPSLTIDWR